MDEDDAKEAADLHVFSSDRFEDMVQIGAGGCAKVYAAFDTELERRVAVKKAANDAILDELGGFEKLDQAGLAGPLRAYIDDLDQGVMAQYSLLHEARLLAQVHVPGVVSVLEVGQFEDGAVGLVMPELSRFQPVHTFPWRLALASVTQLGEGLAMLHRAQILHRDIKPENVLYDTSNRACLADLGLGCEFEDELRMPHRVGSINWLAPESLLLGPHTVQTDLYAFCMVAFQMFFGYAPFVDNTAKMRGAVVELERKDPMPPVIREALVKGLRPNPADRWESMAELIAALHEYARLPNPRVQPAKRSRPWAAAAASVGVAAALGAGVWAAIPEAQADACDEVSRELAEVWDHDIEHELRAVLGSRRPGDRVGGFASRWLAVRAQECAAAKRAQQPLLASPCSMSVRHNLSVIVDTLRSPAMREGVDVGRLLSELPDPEYCLEHPKHGEYASGGLPGLRRLDIEVAALLMSEQLERAEQKQTDYMLAARELGAEYDIARAIYWRAKLRRQRGELDEAEADLDRALAGASALEANEFAGEAMLELAVIAGARGDWMRVDERASLAAKLLAKRRPDKRAEVLEVHGLALVEHVPGQQGRGLALLREAVAEREGGSRGGGRAKVGRSKEALGRGLLAADRAEEALGVVKETLAIYEDEFGGTSKEAHDVRRLVFVAQVRTERLSDAFATEGALLYRHNCSQSWPAYVEEALWMSQVYADVGQPSHASKILDVARQVTLSHDLADLTRNVDAKLSELAAASRQGR